MTERERIIDILNKNFTQEVECTPVYTTADGKEIELPQELCDIFNDIVTQAVIPYFADALVAAGIGDLKEAERKAKVLERAFRNFLAEYFTAVNEQNSYDCGIPEMFGRYANVLPYEDNVTSELNKWLDEAEKELAEEGKE